MVFVILLEVKLVKVGDARRKMVLLFIFPLNLEIHQDTWARGGGGKEWGGSELFLTRRRPQVPGAAPSEVKHVLPGWLTVPLAFPHNRFPCGRRP